MKKIVLLLLTIALTLRFDAFAQSTHTIKGKVTDATTGDAVPFANIAIKGSISGGTTDFDGNYTIRYSPPADSIIVTYVGYVSKTKAIVQNQAEQSIDIQLTPDVLQLREVKVYAGENPAYAIIRKIIANRKINNPEKLEAYECESYTKVQIDIDNISEKFRKSRAVKKITEVVEKYDEIKGEDGQTIIPVFISESASNVYSRTNPKKKKELINKTKISGVGLTDGSFVSQVIGSSFQQYNFYSNWLKILEKDFPSPISDSWKVYYEYYLADSVYNGTNYDYHIEFDPKREQDLAFTGSLWVDGASFALTQIDASVGKKANINFIEKIKVQQSYELYSDDTTWLPTKTRVLIDAEEPTKNAAGMLLKFYTANSNYILNKPRDPKFYDEAVELSLDYKEHTSEYWEKKRPETLSETEKLSFQLVDSLRNLPVIKTYTEILNIAVNGYKKINAWNIDLGPYLYAYANNKIEGNRFRLGFRTDPQFSRKWIMGGYGAYGTRDGKFKYGANIDYILSRKPWTVAGVSYSKDLERLGISNENIGGNTLFGAFSRFGAFRRAYEQENYSAYFKKEIVKGLSQLINIRHQTFNPLFSFAYRTDPTNPETSTLRSSYGVTEMNFETRLARREIFLQNDNERISMGNGNSPIVTFRYTLGLRNFLSGDFNYQKFTLSTKQNFRLGVLGRTSYSVTLGYIPSTIPYPLLYTPLGNESLFYVDNAYNLMNYFEFISDKYLVARVEHNFEGLFFNRIPAIRKLKLRSLVTGKMFYGRVSQANINLIPDTDNQGKEVETFSGLAKSPYIELGYGIDNIFKVGRVDFVHRITYRNTPDATRFGVKISFWFSL